MYAENHQRLSTRQEELLEELKALVDQGFEQAKAEWDHNVQNWSVSFDQNWSASFDQNWSASFNQAVICVIDGRYSGAL